MKRRIYYLFGALLMLSCNEADEVSTLGRVVFSAELIQGTGSTSVASHADIVNGGEVLYLTPDSQDFIDNIKEVIMTFQVEPDIDLYVEGERQVSGESIVDLSSDVEYTLIRDGGSAKNFTVSLKAPQNTGLPVVSVITENGASITSKIDYNNALISVKDPNLPGNNIELKEAGIRGRGNTTWQFPKKPYRIKFDKKTSMFGHGAAKSWVLLANWLDPTFIMNSVTMELGHRLDLPFTNHMHHVELFINGKYQGSYALTEQIQVNQHRVNVDEDNGFLVELDKYYDEDFKFLSSKICLPVNVKSPEVSDESGIEFVKETIEELMDAIFSAGNIPNASYRDIIDVPTLIDYILVNEIVRNGSELYHPKSVFMHRDAVGKIFMGPLWDFDWCFGKSGNKYFIHQDLYFYEKDLPWTTNYKNQNTGEVFFVQFFKDEQFRREYNERWNAIKPMIADISGYVQELGATLERSAAEDERRWSGAFGYTPRVYGVEVDKMMNWLDKHISVIDEEIDKL